MKNITLKDNEALRKLVFLTGKDKTSLIGHILNCAVKEDVIEDEPDFCGDKLMYYFKISDFTLFSATLYCLCRSTKELERVFEGLIIWGIPNECEICGCKLKTEEELSDPDRDDGRREVLSETVTCSNPMCDYYNVKN